jgi:hypothetical protein
MSLAKQTRTDFDGVDIPLSDTETHAENTFNRHEHVNIEYWGLAIPEGIFGDYGDYGLEESNIHAFRNNTYKGLRLIGKDYSLYYSVHCTGEREYYDVRVSYIHPHGLACTRTHIHTDPASSVTLASWIITLTNIKWHKAIVSPVVLSTIS